MTGHEHLKNLFNGEYGNTLALLEQMNCLRKAWLNYKPHLSLNRSDIMLMGVILHKTNCNDDADKEEITVSTLAKLLNQSVAGISKKVTDLEEAGFVERVVSKKDRRVASIQFTKKGKEQTEMEIKKFINVMEGALLHMGEEKTNQLILLMKDLNLALAQTTGKLH